MNFVWFCLIVAGLVLNVHGDECHLTPVIHVLQYPGCVPKPIPSFACQGRCTSYVQVSGSKIWQTERSCMCCQESGEREASVALFCPKAGYDEPKVRKDGAIMPSEIASFVDAGQLVNSFGPVNFQ